jgi:hypothetical protein
VSMNSTAIIAHSLLCVRYEDCAIQMPQRNPPTPCVESAEFLWNVMRP